MTEQEEQLQIETDVRLAIRKMREAMEAIDQRRHSATPEVVGQMKREFIEFNGGWVPVQWTWGRA